MASLLFRSLLNDYTYSVENNTANIEKTNVGYIVKSKLDDTFFFLGNESRGIDLPVIRKE
ncbi:MAG: hypothetical protein Ta2G_17790 [Termitinemataceae bacterium]|nr:MAG: hypothetical protein Ta2G_17790 [Termitinemataceae bacterium]